MARKPCVAFPGAFFHVSARGNHRQGIFHDDTDRAAYKEVGQQVQRDPSVISRLYASYAAHRDEEREARLSQAIRMREQKVNMQACPLFLTCGVLGCSCLHGDRSSRDVVLDRSILSGYEMGNE